MKFELTGMTHTGLARKHNEDSFWLDNDLGAAIVSDGMGGQAAGEVASAITVESFKKVFTLRLPRASSQSDIVTMLANSVGLANQEVIITMQKNPTQSNMGATSVSACLWRGYFTISNVGDSRAYLIDKGSISQLTKDDSVVQRMIDDGLLDEEGARTHPNRNLITQYIGNKKPYKPAVTTFEAVSGQIVLLCSDGLSGLVTDDEILSIVTSSQSPDDACNKLIKATLEKGAHDNVTVVLFAIS
ncbi:Stp1/IreP family PP2C-type Ser/Thr phosphatase [Candidatus Latescibacterota bacterium]